MSTMAFRLSALPAIFGALTLLPTVSFAAVSALTTTECEVMRQQGVMGEGSPVQCERLKNVNFSYVDFDGKTHKDGKIVVLDAVAPYVSTIFNDLYALDFPIKKAQPIEKYQGSDDKSMADNNTSAFNYRAIAGQKSLSIHAYGLAIDLNPVQNPFIEFKDNGAAKFKPAQGADYTNRMKHRFGKADRQGMAEEVISTFARNGFQYWGGFWNTPIDYQHFQVSRDMAKLMTTMDSQSASDFFGRYVEWYGACEQKFQAEYKKHQFRDYTNYLKDTLQVTSLSAAYESNAQAVLSAISQQPTSYSKQACVRS